MKVQLYPEPRYPFVRSGEGYTVNEAQYVNSVGGLPWAHATARDIIRALDKRHDSLSGENTELKGRIKSKDKKDRIRSQVLDQLCESIRTANQVALSEGEGIVSHNTCRAWVLCRALKIDTVEVLTSAIKED